MHALQLCRNLPGQSRGTKRILFLCPVSTFRHPTLSLPAGCAGQKGSGTAEWSDEVSEGQPCSLAGPRCGRGEPGGERQGLGEGAQRSRAELKGGVWGEGVGVCGVISAVRA